ncbi:DUF6647 family protein [Roseibium sp. LAB1]
MALGHLAGLRLACTLQLCLLAFLVPAAAQPAEPVALLEADDMPGLVSHLEDWLDDNTSLPRREEAAAIRWMEADQFLFPSDTVRVAHDSNPRGYYDADRTSIWLVRPWNPRNPQDVSVLLHELVHHRQAAAGHWYCPGAQELPAYRLQQAWLDGFGLKANVNWIAVVLESGCTPRDIHPD